MDDVPVTIIVKAPNQQFEDQTIKCEISWTIERLKSYLSEVYPNKPKSDEQKLIYSGKLLRDSAVLKDILRQYDGQDTHTVHLVFTPKNQRVAEAKSASAASSSTTTTSSSAPSAAAGEDSASSSSSSSAANDMRQATSATTGAAAPLHSSSALFNAQMLMAQQFAMQNTMQQIYMQYMHQYMSHAAAANPNQFYTPSDVSAPPPTADPATSQAHANAVPYPMQFNQQQQQLFYQSALFQQQLMAAAAAAQQQQLGAAGEATAAAAPAQADNNADGQPPRQRLNAAARIVAAAAGGGDADDNQDWLDLFYAMTRLMVLLALVLFYSSPTRLLIVILFVVTYHVYRAVAVRQDRFVRNIEIAANADGAAAAVAAANPNAQPEEAAAAAAAAGGGGVEEPAAPAAAAETSATASDAVAGQDPNHQRMPIIALIRTVVLSFFTSLIPETPHL